MDENFITQIFHPAVAEGIPAKIMTDALPGQCRGYEFVRFSDETDRRCALVEMQGVFYGDRPMHISTATPKTRSHQYAGHGHAGGQQMLGPVPGGARMAGGPWDSKVRDIILFDGWRTAMTHYRNPGNAEEGLGRESNCMNPWRLLASIPLERSPDDPPPHPKFRIRTGGWLLSQPGHNG